jgi:hypothetical protein
MTDNPTREDSKLIPDNYHLMVRRWPKAHVKIEHVELQEIFEAIRETWRIMAGERTRVTIRKSRRRRAAGTLCTWRRSKSGVTAARLMDERRGMKQRYEVRHRVRNQKITLSIKCPHGTRFVASLA